MALAALFGFLSHRFLPIPTSIGILVFANTVLLTAMASRLVLLSYVDVVAIPATSTNYLSPLYPALLLFCLFALADGARLLARAFGRRSGQTTA